MCDKKTKTLRTLTLELLHLMPTMLINNHQKLFFWQPNTKPLSPFIPLNKKNRLPIIGFNMWQKNQKQQKIPWNSFGKCKALYLMLKVLPPWVILYMGNPNEHETLRCTSFNILVRAYNNLNLGLMLKMKWQLSNLGNKGLGLNPKLICQTWFQP